MFRSILRSSLCVVAVFTAAPAWAEAGPAKAGLDDSSTTRITSRTMTVKNQENKAIFQGDVILTRGALKVHSDEMVVFFRATGSTGQSDHSGDHSNDKGNAVVGPDKSKRSADLPTVSNRSVSMVEATGSVVIEKDDGRATCRKAIYYESEGKIVLTGNPVAWQKGTKVSGEKMTMYLAEDRSVIEGGSQVVIEEAGQASH
jgi:lipopolysaccharide export system protein LptA